MQETSILIYSLFYAHNIGSDAADEQFEMFKETFSFIEINVIFQYF